MTEENESHAVGWEKDDLLFEQSKGNKSGGGAVGHISEQGSSIVKSFKVWLWTIYCLYLCVNGCVI